MRIAITMTAYRRPRYTARVLEALMRCVLPERTQFQLHLSIDHGPAETIDVVHRSLHGQLPFSINLYTQPKRLGLNANTHYVLSKAYNQETDAVIHLEDDTVPSPDALVYWAWALEKFEDRDDVFSISGYNRSTGEEPFDGWDSRPWFTCWGWAMTRRRIRELLKRWNHSRPKTFATPINKVIRGNRLEIYPLVSRIQNIGYEMGENGRSPSWYRKNHRVACVASHYHQGVWV